MTTFWEADSGQFERQIFAPEARKKVDLGGAAGAPRGKKRQISGAEGAQKQKRQILGAPEAVSLHGVPSIEIELNI